MAAKTTVAVSRTVRDQLNIIRAELAAQAGKPVPYITHDDAIAWLLAKAGTPAGKDETT